MASRAPPPVPGRRPPPSPSASSQSVVAINSDLAKAFSDEKKDGEQWIWIQDEVHAYLPAKRIGELFGGQIDVQLENGVRRAVPVDQTCPLDKNILSKNHEDLVLLEELTAPYILNLLKTRYSQDMIYTNIGTILISLNPYKPLPIYTPESIERYKSRGLNEMSPHVFIIADQAYRDMVDANRNQSIIISGESGAGKTEATKQALQYVAEVAGSESNVEQKILLANPILEAFGNAKTVRNNNSSRFGKYIEIFFDSNFRIIGAQVTNYLLEKVRVVLQAAQERNYHVFYQLCSGSSAEQKKRYLLDDPSKFYYLNQSKTFTAPGIDDTRDFGALQKAMNNIGIDEKESDFIFQTTSAVLHLGNLEFKEVGDRQSNLIPSPSAEWLSKFLQTPVNILNTLLTSRQLKIKGRDNTSVSLSAKDAGISRDAFAKFIYNRLFDSIVYRVNSSIATSKKKGTKSVGVLDIFGFEIFQSNSFEQLCINYTNEKLQQHFNNQIFKLEEVVYKEEGIQYNKIDFKDNQIVLDLIETRPAGIFAILDEVSKFPNGTDKQFIDEMHKKLEKNPAYSKDFKNPILFVIHHFAGDVEYESVGFLEKNKDSLSEDLLVALAQSENAQIRNLFQSEADTKARKQSLGFQFSSQLTDLMYALNSTEPHYIRCIKPNKLKEAGYFDGKMILEQLTNSGVFQAVEIRKSGFPFRLFHDEFCRRYKAFAPTLKFANPLDGVNKLLGVCKIDTTDIRIGKKRILYKAKEQKEFERLRLQALRNVILTIQRYTRGWLIRKMVRVWRIQRAELLKAMKKRDRKGIEAALGLCSGFKFEFAEIAEAYELREVLIKEEEYNAYLDKLLRKGVDENFEEYSRAFISIDEMGLMSPQAEALKQAVDGANQRRDVELQLEAALNALDEGALQNLLSQAGSLKMDKYAVVQKAKATLKKFQESRSLIDSLQSALNSGAYMKEGDTIQVNQLKSILKKIEGSQFELSYESQEYLRYAQLIVQFREMLMNCFETDDQAYWTELESFIIQNQQDLGTTPEVQKAGELLGMRNGKATIAEDLETAISQGNYAEVEYRMQQAQNLGIPKAQIPQFDRAMNIRSSVAGSHNVLAEALNCSDLEQIRSAIEYAENLNLGGNLLNQVKARFAKCQELETRAESCLDSLDRTEMKEVLEESARVKLVSPTLLKLNELLYHTSAEKFVQAQLKAAIRIGDQEKITQITIKLKDLLFEQIGDMFEFRKYPKLYSPDEFASLKRFGLTFNKDKIAGSFYSYTDIPIHTSMTRDLRTKLVTDSMTMFKTILAFMGDRENATNHLILGQEVLAKGILTPALRAEIYCQIIKQLTNNPSTASSALGWQLMLACLDCFPPSSDFENYLEMHVRSKAPDKPLYLRRLHQTMYQGAKPDIPSIDVVRDMLVGESWRSAPAIKFEEKKDVGTGTLRRKPPPPNPRSAEDQKSSTLPKSRPPLPQPVAEQADDWKSIEVRGPAPKPPPPRRGAAPQDAEIPTPQPRVQRAATVRSPTTPQPPPPQDQLEESFNSSVKLWQKAVDEKTGKTVSFVFVCLQT
jgi:myosin heavy subunit